MSKKIPNLNWFTVTKKYWKEQIILYAWTTISFLGSWFISKNSVNFIYDLIKKGQTEKIEYKIVGFSKGSVIHNFEKKLSGFLTTMALIVVVYCAVVFAHVYFGFWLNNKIIREVKKKIASKALKMKGSINEKRTLNNLIYDSRVFADWVVYAPNQIYYIILETIVAFWLISGSPSNVIWWALGYFLLTLAICGLFNFLLYKKDLLFQKQLEKQTNQENKLVKYRNLIIKKNLGENYSKSYDQTLKNTQRIANEEDLLYTSAFVVPSYSLIKYSKYFFLPFVSSSDDFVAFTMFTDLLDAMKKMIERLRNYTYYFSAKKRLNDFLTQEERNDLQKNILIYEPIEIISLKNVGFSYQPNKPVLNNYSVDFCKGQVNHLKGENGSGKSTTINLIMGLYQPKQGEIIINSSHKLSEINLKTWREKIAYAEHKNLVENGLSTGQKQLIDLNILFAEEENKEVFIFDEADNALDENNKKEFRRKIEKISKEKLVILISH